MESIYFLHVSLIMFSQIVIFEVFGTPFYTLLGTLCVTPMKDYIIKASRVKSWEGQDLDSNVPQCNVQP